MSKGRIRLFQRLDNLVQMTSYLPHVVCFHYTLAEEVEVSGLDDTIPMAEEVTEMPKQTFSSITFQFNNSSQDNSSEEEDDEEVICEDDEFDEEQESGEEEDDVEKGGDEFEPGKDVNEGFNGFRTVLLIWI